MFDAETLESLLTMAEGPTLDFKREQYRFNKASDRDKSELLKDILAFANSQRHRTSYVLVGVEEVKGGRSKVVGVAEHLDDANLHQFVNSKTNRPVDFSYLPYWFEEKEIGVISIPIQNRPVYALNKFGKVERNVVYIRDGSSTRPASPDEIAVMGRGTPPEWAVDQLRTLAKNSVIIAVKQWRENPYWYRQYGIQVEKTPTYEEAREFVLVGTPPFEDYADGIDSYASLHWVFGRFEDLSSFCGQMFRTVGSSFTEYGPLIRAMINLENYVEPEKQVWKEFRLRTKYPSDPLPAEANYNVMVIAKLAVRLIDVLDSENLEGDPDYESRRQFAPEVVWRQPNKWGDWR